MPAAPATGGSSHRSLAVLLALLSAVGPFCIDAYLPSMEEIGRAFGQPLEAVQQTLSAFMVTFALMTLWHGAISDAVGRRRVILVALGLFTLASLGCALAPSFSTLLVFRALQGMTAGTGMVVGRAVVRDVLDGPEAQKLMALVSMTFAVAPSVAPVVGGWLHHWFGWRSVFFFMAAFAAAVGLACWKLLPETLPPERRQPFHPAYLLRSYARVATSPAFMAAALGMALGFGGMFVYVLSAPVFLMRHLGVAETEFVWLFGPITAGMLLGAWLSGRLAGKVTPVRTVASGLGLMGVAALVNVGMTAAVPPGVPWSVAPLFLYSLGMALTTPSLTLLALDLFPTQRGLAASCQSFVQSTGNSLNAALLAPLVWVTPMRLALTELVFLGLAAVAVGVHVRSTRRLPLPASPGLAAPGPEPARP